ncbi:MAG: WYL domain-containing protein [Armatimonadetes bacterium]|nr:WYL domain-containing protein [Armatimonadota bacterium]
MSQTERIYWLDAEIRGGRYPNAETLRSRWEVSRRTAFGDSKFLKERLKAPLMFDKRRGGWFYSDATYSLPYLALSESEANTLCKTLLVAQEYLSPTDSEPLRQVVEKLQTYLPKTSHSHSEMRGSIHLAHALSSGLATDCEQAIQWRKRVEILYYSGRRDATTERVIHPYALLMWRGEPHLIAWCEWRQDIRQFFLGRIRQWRVLEQERAFARQEGFDVEEYLRRGLDMLHGAELVRVRVRFSAYQARWIRERRYHESQTIEELEGGGSSVF